MKIKSFLIATLTLLMVLSSGAAAKKKKQPDRGMLEKMEAVPCGAKERGLTGLGALYGSVGIAHVNSDEKLCPQYLFRTDDMEYHIRPADGKHPVILPIGHEGEFKIKKDFLYLRVPDGDRKTRPYQVVSMKPLDTGSNTHTDTQGSANRPQDKPEVHPPSESTMRPIPKPPGNSLAPPPQ